MSKFLLAWLTSIYYPLLCPATRAQSNLGVALRMVWRMVGKATATLTLMLALLVAGGSWMRPTPLSFPTSLFAQATAPNCIDLIVNGSFEQTATGWESVPGASLFTYAGDQAVNGRRSLLLGFSAPLNITATFGVEQLLTLPAESTSIDIAFAYAVENTGGLDEGDQAYLAIYDAENDQLLAMLVFSPTHDTWNLGRYDLTPLAGKAVRLTFVAQNDGEPGRIAMRVDDVAVTACLPLDAFALDALPTPAQTPVSRTAELLMLTPLVPSTPVPGANPGAPAGLPPSQMPPANEAFPPAARIESLDQCNCSGSLYACSSFSSWAIAQACYTHCQVTVGYDIHNLDPDRNGVACELELQDVAPLDATPSPQSTPLLPTNSISETNATTPTASQPVTATGMVTRAVVITNANATPGMDAAINTTNSTDTVAVAAAPLATAFDPLPSPAPNTSPVTPSNTTAELMPWQMISSLLFSPLGYLLLGVVVVIGGLSLWVAFLLGQRNQPRNPPLPPAHATNSSPQNSTTEDFARSSNQEISAPKT